MKQAPRIFLLSSSIRDQSRTRMAVNIAIDELNKQGAQVDIFDPRHIKLESLGQSFPENIRKDLHERILKADGLLFGVPEYNGSFSSVMLSVIENLGYPSVCVGKVVNILGVAAGTLGATKSIEQLRSVLSHNGALVLPCCISIANAADVFSEDGKCTDSKSESLIRSVADNLLYYIASKKIKQFGSKTV